MIPAAFGVLFDVWCVYVECLKAFRAVRLDDLACLGAYAATFETTCHAPACIDAHAREEPAMAAMFVAEAVRFIGRCLSGVLVRRCWAATPLGNHLRRRSSTELRRRGQIRPARRRGMAQAVRGGGLASGAMRVIGALFSVICAVLGGLQVWAATRRRSDEFFILRSAGQSSLLAFEFAGSPAKLRSLVAAGGDRGRDAVLRSLDIDYLVTAGYVFVTLGFGGILTAVSRPGLGRKEIVFGLVAAAVAVIENVALRQAASSYPDGGGTAPLVTFAAVIKFVLLLLAAGTVLLWPLRTWLN